MDSGVKDVTVIFPYYENPEMLRFQLAHYVNFSPAIQSRMEIVVVDDGSPMSAAADIAPAEYPISLSIFRILEDKPWNQDAARNIGAFEASGRYLLLTDVDHIVPEYTLKGLLDAAKPGVAFTMGRKAHFSEATKDSHVNSYFIARESFWELGGYDEDFWGAYGSDWLFRRALSRRFPIVLLEDLKLELVTQGSIPDAKNKVFSRKPSLGRRVITWALRALKFLRLRPSPQGMKNPYVKVR